MHLVENREALIARVRRIAGQVAAIERHLAGDASCSATLQLVAAVRGAVGGLMDEIVEDHIRQHVARPDISPDDRAAAAEELIAIVKRYGK